MQIFVDADALPNVIKDILFRAVKRLRIPLTMVANQYVTVEKSKYIKSIVVSSGPLESGVVGRVKKILSEDS